MEFLQYVWGGLAAGALYATAAMGFTLMVKTTGLLNFAYGDMAAMGAAIALWLLRSHGLPYGVAVIGALAFSAVFAVALERGLLRPLHAENHLIPIILTMGVSLVLNGILTAFMPVPLPFPRPIDGDMIIAAGVYISPDSLLVMGIVTAIMLAMYLFITFTKTGIALRAAAQDLVTARLMGIPTNAVFAISWAVASALGTAAAVLIAPTTSVDPYFMNEVLMKAFIAAILGGLGNLPGALVGGLIVGVMENLVAGYVSSEMKAVFIFLILLVILVVRPQGIFGAPMSRRV